MLRLTPQGRNPVVYGRMQLFAIGSGHVRSDLVKHRGRIWHDRIRIQLDLVSYGWIHGDPAGFRSFFLSYYKVQI